MKTVFKFMIMAAALASMVLVSCKKDNKDKDDPKRIDLAVSKATYLPVYMKTKAKGIKISMENFKLGVNETEVTFNPADYPNAKIIDER